MASRTYYNRQDFKEGWDARTGRYESPGTLKNMLGTMLDIYERGAVRQTWGAHPVVYGPISASTASQWRIDYSDYDYKFPGVCLLDRIKYGGRGGDQVVYGENTKVGSTYTTKFYVLDAPNTVNAHQFSNPFGSTLSVEVPLTDTFDFGPLQLAYMHGRDPNDPDFTISTLAAHLGTANFFAGQHIRYTAPALFGSGNDTLSLRVTDNVSGATSDVDILIDFVPAGNITGGKNHYIINPSGAHHATSSMSSINPRDQFNKAREMVDGPFVVWPNLRNFYNGSTISSGATNSLAFGSTFSGDLPYLSYMRSLAVDQVTSIPCTYSGVACTVSFYTPRLAHHQPGSLSPTYRAYSTPRTEIAEIVEGNTGTVNSPMGSWRVVTMNDRAYFYNGFSGSRFGCLQDTPTDTFTIGLARPDISSISVTGAVGTNVKGIVKYSIAELDEDENEGPLSEWFPGAGSELEAGSIKGSAAAQGGWNAGDGTAVDLTAIPTNAVSKKIRLYRTLADRSQPYLLADLTASGTFTTVDYTDDILDVNLGDLPWTHGDIPPYDFFSPVVYYDRVWGLGSRPGVDRMDNDGNTYTVEYRRTTLFWSDINQPESFWWDGNWANVYADDGDEVTCLLRDPTGLLVFKNNHLYRMTGRIPEDITFIEVTAADSATGVGTPTPHSAISTEYGSFFYFNGGVYIYGSGQARKISDPISPYLETAQYTVFSTQHTSESEVTLSYDPIHKILFFSIRDGALDSGGATFLFDVEEAKWIGRYTFPINFIRRLNIPLYYNWALSSSFGSTISGMYCAVNYTLADANDFSSEGTVMLIDPEIANWSNRRQDGKMECHPLVGTLSPYEAKRFLWVDYLLDADEGLFYSGAGGNFFPGATGSVLSTLYLDGTTTGNSDTLSVDGGAIYSDRVRHVFGGVGAEMEIELELDINSDGEVHKLFEYAYAWQPVSKHSVGSGGIGAAPPV